MWGGKSFITILSHDAQIPSHLNYFVCSTRRGMVKLLKFQWHIHESFLFFICCFLHIVKTNQDLRVRVSKERSHCEKCHKNGLNVSQIYAMREKSIQWNESSFLLILLQRRDHKKWDKTRMPIFKTYWRSYPPMSIIHMTSLLDLKLSKMQ